MDIVLIMVTSLGVKLLFGNRADAKAYNAYTNDGITGISTGGIVRRLYPLKWNNYS